ncbi:hypothetical protein I3842_16G053500 [Carya illinoinensis]|uniref:Uncharacterized protein n=1 Tax=Carya illinoinensis TaxID=32201 RepID=A0A922D5E3_CARIL|nr:hypothetical protein I3842_16G053500 [Carya illinoinensis]
MAFSSHIVSSPFLLPLMLTSHLSPTIFHPMLTLLTPFLSCQSRISLQPITTVVTVNL